MPLFLGAAAVLENVLAAGDVCTAGGFLSTASLEHKYSLLHKSKQRFRFFKTRVCSEEHVFLIFQHRPKVANIYIQLVGMSVTRGNNHNK